MKRTLVVAMVAIMMMVTHTHAQTAVLVDNNTTGTVVGIEMATIHDAKVLVQIGEEQKTLFFPMVYAKDFHLGQKAEVRPSTTDSVMADHFQWLVNNLPPDALMRNLHMRISARAGYQSVVLTLYKGEEKTPTLLIHLQQMDENTIKVSCMKPGVNDPILLKNFAVTGLACFREDGQRGVDNIELFRLGEQLLATQQEVVTPGLATLGDD